MNAVAEKPQLRARPANAVPARKAAEAAAPTHEKCKALFQTVALCLQQASQTNETHAFSGDSNRLLGIGASIAQAASKADTPENQESDAYDVAACINAARLVPGDTESTARTAFIATAAAALGQVTGDTPERIVFINLLRSSAPEAPPSKKLFNAAFDEATCWLSCASGVMDFYASNSDSDLMIGLSDLIRHYVESAVVPGQPIGDYRDGPLPDLSVKLAAAKEVVEAANDDDIMLHAVSYLLEHAMNLAGGIVAPSVGQANA